mmetsp:Transcript_2509/g.5779  ORF Transcript_2509/g.5779 Transcript_2509/m.5779 type:complete len:1344 (+) Transcript_2509:145-4176(+)
MHPLAPSEEERAPRRLGEEQGHGQDQSWAYSQSTNQRVAQDGGWGGGSQNQQNYHNSRGDDSNVHETHVDVNLSTLNSDNRQDQEEREQEFARQQHRRHYAGLDDEDDDAFAIGVGAEAASRGERCSRCTGRFLRRLGSCLCRCLFCGCIGKRRKFEEGSRRIYVNDAESTHELGVHATNLVSTTKYTWYDFVPKFAVEAFSKFANAYFLVVCFLQAIPDISITNGVPYNAMPLATVLLVEAVALILEDSQRQKDDIIANTSNVVRLEAEGSFRRCTWADVRVGDILCIKNREPIPADLMILATSNENGQCFVETKSLDGETNLKLRQAVSGRGIGMSGLELLALRGSIEFQQPDAIIDSFDGFVSLQTVDNVTVERTLTIENLLLRGCILRNTNVVCGIVLNCGHDTKIMMGSTGTQAKLSDLDIKVNQYLVRFLAFEVIISILAAVLSRRWFIINGQNAYYLELQSFAAKKFVTQIFTFFLLIANMIPIALYVAMKFARFFQAQVMMMDSEMWLPNEKNPDLVTPMRVRSMDLNDALGQVDHLFTDKTGTLTTNLMEFRKCSIAGKSYGLGSTSIGIKSLERKGQAAHAEELRKQTEDLPALHAQFFHFIDNPEDSLVKAMQQENQFGEGTMYEFFTALALCHEVLLERVHDEYGRFTGEIRLSAASPEDQALVSAANEFGVEFCGRNHEGDAELMVLSYRGQNSSRVRTFEILQVFDFTSSRKRMSVIARDAESHRVHLICKGGDDVMFARVRRPCGHLGATEAHLNRYAEEGLRTLVVAQRELEWEEYERWQFRFNTVKSDLDELSKRKRKEPNAIDSLMDELETNMDLLGAVAIEDRLQDEVPETLQQLSEAGMKIWMLTGDKLETALNIGYACNLFPDELQVVSFGNAAAGNVGPELAALAQSSDDREIALVLEGRAIDAALFDATEAFAKLSLTRCRAVVACRSSPLQKSALVKFIKRCKYAFRTGGQTLAVGDGANDVPMIQAAHIGVGIQAAGGMQAANSAEYSIAQFRYLSRLLLVHGRSNYRRISKLILFTFYKNIMLTSAQFLFSFANGWSGQKYYFELGVQSFNLIFTMLPSFLLAVFDKDLPDFVVLRFPEVYELGLKNQVFTSNVFWQWIWNAVWHAFIIFASVAGLWQAHNHDLWQQGCMVLSLVILVANSKIFFELSRWTYVDHCAWWLTLILWPCCALVFELPMWLRAGTEWGFVWLGVFSSVASNPTSWLVVLFAFVVCFVRDFTAKGWRRAFDARIYHVLQECLAFNKSVPTREEFFASHERGPLPSTYLPATDIPTRPPRQGEERFRQLHRMSTSISYEDEQFERRERQNSRRDAPLHIELT